MEFGDDPLFERTAGGVWEGFWSGAMEVASESVDCVTTDILWDPADAVRPGGLALGVTGLTFGASALNVLSFRMVLGCDISVLDVI